MSSKREQILASLHEKFRGLETSKIRVFRNLDKPPKISDTGIIILRDGESGEPEVLLNPVAYIYEHTANIEIIVQNPDSATRDAQLDVLLVTLGGIINNNRTLGGIAEWVEAKSPEFIEEPIEGAGTMKLATVPVMIRFFTNDPLN